MKSDLSYVEDFRFSVGPYTSKKGDRYGLFKIPFESRKLIVMVAPDVLISGKLTQWEHVSVSLPNRCPHWNEMAHIKGLFWNEEDVVIQFHPRKSEYVNMSPNCLHLWKWNGGEMPTPPSIYVGF